MSQPVNLLVTVNRSLLGKCETWHPVYPIKTTWLCNRDFRCLHQARLRAIRTFTFIKITTTRKPSPIIKIKSSWVPHLSRSRTIFRASMLQQPLSSLPHNLISRYLHSLSSIRLMLFSNTKTQGCLSQRLQSSTMQLSCNSSCLQLLRPPQLQTKA